MKMNETRCRKSEKGFTLVELAIVMIIIGLLIGGVLKGQELVSNAQVTATISQIKGIEAATSTFRDSFGAFPGDLPNATARLANCTGTCQVGAASATVGNSQINQDPGAAMAVEGLAAFAMLAAADLINGVNATPIDATINFGDESPETPIGGSGLVMGWGATNGTVTAELGQTWTAGHYLAISPNPAADIGTATGTVALTPLQALKIDNKLDNGMPNTGSVRSGGATTCNAEGALTPAADYGNATVRDCTVFVRIQ